MNVRECGQGNAARARLAVLWGVKSVEGMDGDDARMAMGRTIGAFRWVMVLLVVACDCYSPATCEGFWWVYLAPACDSMILVFFIADFHSCPKPSISTQAMSLKSTDLGIYLGI
jgi:hypothetical protein